VDIKLGVTVMVELIELLGRALQVQKPEDVRAALQKLHDDGVKPISSEEVKRIGDEVVG
jgi:hypothetical protein